MFSSLIISKFKLCMNKNVFLSKRHIKKEVLLKYTTNSFTPITYAHSSHTAKRLFQQPKTNLWLFVAIHQFNKKKKTRRSSGCDKTSYQATQVKLLVYTRYTLFLKKKARGVRQQGGGVSILLTTKKAGETHSKTKHIAAKSKRKNKNAI